MKQVAKARAGSGVSTNEVCACGKLLANNARNDARTRRSSGLRSQHVTKKVSGGPVLGQCPPPRVRRFALHTGLSSPSHTPATLLLHLEVTDGACGLV